MPADFSANPAAGWVVKPDDGAGAQQTAWHARRDAALQAANRLGPGFVVEPWVPGDSLSVSLACTPTTVELLSINRQRLHTAADGQVHVDAVECAALPLHGERADRLRAFAGQVHAALPGLAGYVGVDLVWHAQRGPVAIEVNPRLTSAYVGLSQRLGFNVAQRLLPAPRR